MVIGVSGHWVHVLIAIIIDCLLDHIEESEQLLHHKLNLLELGIGVQYPIKFAYLVNFRLAHSLRVAGQRIVGTEEVIESLLISLVDLGKIETGKI